MKTKRKYTFTRWLKHLVAFNKTSISFGVWRFRHLFHDIDKPFLNLFMSADDVRIIHRYNSKHHIEHNDVFEKDYIGMVIDWECARFTKPDKPYGARDTYIRFVKNNITVYERAMIESVLDKLNL